MSKPCLISFVVPCYNYGRFLPECLNSIFSQKGNWDFEVIVIDDGSTDNTPKILSNFSDPRLKIIKHTKNMGHAVTISEGLTLTTGRFVARIDPDDRYRNNFLSSLVPKFYEFPDVGLVYADAALIDESGNITLARSDTQHKDKDFKGNEFLVLLENNFICSATVIAKKEVWQMSLPVPSWLAFHDWYFTLMASRKYDFYYVNEVVAEYRVHSQNYHDKILKNKTEEYSLIKLLDLIFAQEEYKEYLEKEKQKIKNKVYARHYFVLAEKYFGFKMFAEAKRCYLNSLKFKPSYLLKFIFIKRFFAIFIDWKLYAFIKKFFKHCKKSLFAFKTIFNFFCR